LKTVDFSLSVVSVKIGNGVPVYKELVEALDEALPSEVLLEIVSEAGTNRYHHEAKHRRGLRHIVSAIHIAGRVGQVYSRGKTIEQNS
jgi:predicted DNA-binding transcriptional regulator